MAFFSCASYFALAIGALDLRSVELRLQKRKLVHAQEISANSKESRGCGYCLFVNSYPHYGKYYRNCGPVAAIIFIQRLHRYDSTEDVADLVMDETSIKDDEMFQFINQNIHQHNFNFAT